MIVDCIEREESELNANVVIFSIQTAHCLNVRFNKFGLFILMRLSVRSQLKTFSVITGEISRHFSVNRIELNGTKQIDLFGWTFGWHTRMVTSVNILLSWNKTIDNFIVWRQHNMCTKHMKRATEDEYNSIRFDWIVNLVISAFYRTITKMILLFILRFFPFFFVSIFSPLFSSAIQILKSICTMPFARQIYVYVCVLENKTNTQKIFISCFAKIEYFVFPWMFNVMNVLVRTINAVLFGGRGVLPLSTVLLLLLLLWHISQSQFKSIHTNSSQYMHFISRHCFQEPSQSSQLIKWLNEWTNEPLNKQKAIFNIDYNIISTNTL